MMDPFPVLFLQEAALGFLGLSCMSCGNDSPLWIGDCEFDCRARGNLCVGISFNVGEGVEGKVCSWDSKDFGILDFIHSM